MTNSAARDEQAAATLANLAWCRAAAAPRSPRPAGCGRSWRSPSSVAADTGQDEAALARGSSPATSPTAPRSQRPAASAARGARRGRPGADRVAGATGSRLPRRQWPRSPRPAGSRRSWRSWRRRGRRPGRAAERRNLACDDANQTAIAATGAHPRRSLRSRDDERRPRPTGAGRKGVRILAYNEPPAVARPAASTRSWRS